MGTFQTGSSLVVREIPSSPLLSCPPLLTCVVQLDYEVNEAAAEGVAREFGCTTQDMVLSVAFTAQAGKEGTCTYLGLSPDSPSLLPSQHSTSVCSPVKSRTSSRSSKRFISRLSTVRPPPPPPPRLNAGADDVREMDGQVLFRVNLVMDGNDPLLSDTVKVQCPPPPHLSRCITGDHGEHAADAQVFARVEREDRHREQRGGALPAELCDEARSGRRLGAGDARRPPSAARHAAGARVVAGQGARLLRGRGSRLDGGASGEGPQRALANEEHLRRPSHAL